MTPKWSPVKTQFLSPMECEGEEKTLLKFILKKKIVLFLLSENIAEILIMSLIFSTCVQEI